MNHFDIILFVKNLIESLGYLGIFLGTFGESFLLPIPSEILMCFAGFIVSEGKLSGPLVVFFAVLGDVLSSILIWYLGYRFGEDFILKYGKYLGYTKHEFDTSKRLFEKYGYAIIFVCQLIPLMRSVISIPSGALKTKLLPFTISTCLGASIWLSFLTIMGALLGAHWYQVNSYVKHFETPIFIVLFLITLIYIYKHIKNLITINP